jgi:hypothetical protein
MDMDVHMEKRIKNLSREDRYEQQIIGKISLNITGNITGDTTGGAELCSEEPFLCNMVNMSLSGALVETGTAMAVGSLMKYSFRIPGAISTVNVLAEVVRLDGTEEIKKAAEDRKREKLQVYGIRFLDLNDMDRSSIQGYLNA